LKNAWAQPPGTVTTSPAWAESGVVLKQVVAVRYIEEFCLTAFTPFMATPKRWSHNRDPYLLETSVSCVFACGDLRLSPVKISCARHGGHLVWAGIFRKFPVPEMETGFARLHPPPSFSSTFKHLAIPALGNSADAESGRVLQVILQFCYLFEL
jgi:hypothetical protein